MEPLPAHQPSVLSQSMDAAGPPPIPADAVVLATAPGLKPWVQRQQPQVNCRSVLPVEWFRRMPGGGATTYAVPGADCGDDNNDESCR